MPTGASSSRRLLALTWEGTVALLTGAGAGHQLGRRAHIRGHCQRRPGKASREGSLGGRGDGCPPRPADSAASPRTAGDMGTSLAACPTVARSRFSPARRRRHSSLQRWAPGPCRPLPVTQSPRRDPCVRGSGPEGPPCSAACGRRLVLGGAGGRVLVCPHRRQPASVLAGWSLWGSGRRPGLCPTETPVRRR